MNVLAVAVVALVLIVSAIFGDINAYNRACRDAIYSKSKTCDGRHVIVDDKQVYP
jgi:hypothetical protein